MAIRLGDHMQSGVIDSSIRGKVTGELRIEGLENPVTLNLQGYPHPDLAGCVLRFRNPRSMPVDEVYRDALRTDHVGYAGDISAAQKRRIPPYDDCYEDVKSGKLDPSIFPWKNILYLEWFDAYAGSPIELNPELGALAARIRDGAKEFMQQLLDLKENDDRPPESAEWFIFFVKARTAADLLAPLWKLREGLIELASQLRRI
ncbi:MAG: hypothetical protein ACI8UO_000532 [Verrucomicrobiales bacterium]|jgi:hypothetical protein